MRGRVLLAEDNPVIQAVVQRMLEMLGNQVDIAENGHEAVALASRRQYDLILMDCLMPKMDGFKATRFIRKQERDKDRPDLGGSVPTACSCPARVPIVAITSNARSRARCLASGMDDHLRKPFGQTQLREYLKRWVAKESSRDLTQIA